MMKLQKLSKKQKANEIPFINNQLKIKIMKKGTKQPTIKVSHIAETIAREAIRNSFNFVFLHTGENYFEKGGNTFSVEEIEKTYPAIKLQPINYKGQNPDLKKNYINGIKSY